MKIAVLGAGALGSTIGAILASVCDDVWLISRSYAHVTAVAKDGLILTEGANNYRMHLRACLTPAAMAKLCTEAADLIIVLVASPDTEQAIIDAAPIIGPRTMLMTLQNGIGNDAVLAKAVGPERVILGKTFISSVMKAPGHVLTCVRDRETVIGRLDGKPDPFVAAIAGLFNQAGMQTMISYNVISVVWNKLLVSIATGALSAITGLSSDPLFEVREIEATAMAAVAEAMAVAKAKHIRLSTPTPRDAWYRAAAKLSSDYKNLMLPSLEKIIFSEIDFINGAIVSAGIRCGIPTPINRTLVACVKGIEKQRLQKIASAGHGYVEHVAIHVANIGWHIRFCNEVLGMPIRTVEGPSDAPQRITINGGLELISAPNHSNEKGCVAHIGITIQNRKAAIAAAAAWGVATDPLHKNTLKLPSGLNIELSQAAHRIDGPIRAIEAHA